MNLFDDIYTFKTGFLGNFQIPRENLVRHTNFSVNNNNQIFT